MNWKVIIKDDLQGNAKLIQISDENSLLNFEQVFNLFSDNTTFRSFYTGILQQLPYSSIRWEHPQLTTSSLTQLYQCAILNSPELLRPANFDNFREHLGDDSTTSIITFKNLGKDAELIVPKPIDGLSYAHLAEFLMHAPEDQIHELWKTISQKMLKTISKKPLWLSTAGAGVPWLHVRIDSFPKYYNYQPFRK